MKNSFAALALLLPLLSCDPTAALLPEGLEVPQATLENSVLLVRDGYCTCYSYDYNTPLWTAWELTADEASARDVQRKDEFSQDMDLGFDSPKTTDYSRSGYDRGHMAPAGDFMWSDNAMEESFLMSNVCPQDHVLNAGTWNDLEKQCRRWAQKYGQLWICCGPLFEDSPQTIGRECSVSVPYAFYKVVMKEFQGEKTAIGFVIPNEPLEDDFFNYIVSVDEVERMTGIDFFASLPDDIEDLIEASCRKKDWTYYLIKPKS